MARASGCGTDPGPLRAVKFYAAAVAFPSGDGWHCCGCGTHQTVSIAVALSLTVSRPSTRIHAMCAVRSILSGWSATIRAMVKATASRHPSDVADHVVWAGSIPLTQLL